MAKGHAGKQSSKRHRQERASNKGQAAAIQAGRAARRNTANQLRSHARALAISAHREASGGEGPPKVITLVSAGAKADVAAVAQCLLGHAAPNTPPDAATFAVAKQKQRLTLLRPERSVRCTLDASKSADVLLLVIPADGGLDALGEQLVDALAMQGVGTVVGVLQGAEALPQAQRGAARKQWQSSLEARFPAHSKFFALDLDPAGGQLVRHLMALTPRPLTWRTHASYVLAQSYTCGPPLPADGAAALAQGAAASAPLVHPLESMEGGEASDDASAVVEIRGYVRGLPLSIDRAVQQFQQPRQVRSS